MLVQQVRHTLGVVDLEPVPLIRLDDPEVLQPVRVELEVVGNENFSVLEDPTECRPRIDTLQLKPSSVCVRPLYNIVGPPRQRCAEGSIVISKPGGLSVKRKNPRLIQFPLSPGCARQLE